MRTIIAQLCILIQLFLAITTVMTIDANQVFCGLYYHYTIKCSENSTVIHLK